MKFAMIPINCKRDDENNLLIRRVLISYKFKTTRKDIVTFYGTKFLLADQYFYSSDSSLSYKFKNGYYILNTVSSNNSYYDEYIKNKNLFKKRRYHYSKYFMYEKDVEFKANSIQQAIEIFRERSELR